MQDRGSHAGIDATGKPTDDSAGGADLGLDLGDGFVEERRHRPIAASAADLEKVGEQLGAARGVHHFGVELNRVDASRIVGERGHGAIRRLSDVGKAFRQRLDVITVGHPHIERFTFFDAGKQRRVAHRGDDRAAVFALGRRANIAAEQLGGQLRAVANAEHRNTEFVDFWRNRRRAFVVDRRWTTREHHADGRQRAQFFHADVERVDLAVHLLLANAAGDELGVLRSKIEDDDGLMRHERRLTPRGSSELLW